ncbi:hypothetical protein [Streptomyces litchfieldiae]|uniref:Secreted protein n=1 Tax=Streptomyces litchfieldiae TaxID=3075543 RepID=A0ABU2MUV4_9ACTN|nr:hypothetical protein [Streptomyces sp. DSM 44938]MDT0345310.1 hypothetical protein [Streptomyces sp. DSM 44938]
MEIAFALLALSLVMFAVFVALVVRGVRAAKCRIERAGREVRRSLSDAALTARAAQPGVVGEVARTRKELRASVDSTRGALRQGSAEDPALGEALALFDQLDGHFRQLDGELGALMSGEPDRSRIAARLPELRGRAERIRQSADALRLAAQDRARRHGAEELEALQRQIDMEASALRHWAPVDAADGAAGEPGRAAGEAVEPPGPGASRPIPGLRKPDAEGTE